MKFSERLGITSVIPLQIDSMNEALRVSIWNLLLTIINIEGSDGAWQYSLKHLAEYFFKFPTDGVPKCISLRGKEWFRNRYQALQWYEVYNLLGFITQNANISDTYDTSSKTLKLANDVLVRERSGYRFINGQLAPITNEIEMKSIEDAVAAAKRAGLGGVVEHLQTSVQLLGKRPNLITATRLRRP